MHSRAYLLLKRDLVNLQRFPMDGVSAGPISDLNMLQWQARLQGLPDTPWEGGVFHLHLQFTAEFNSVPPAVRFMTIPFHPNVDAEEGTVHCHLLSAGWSEGISVPVLLIALQALLSAPESDSIVNAAASQLLHKAPHAYHQMALDCVSASLRVDAGLTPYEGEDNVTVTATSPASSLLAHLPAVAAEPQPVSFDDYFCLWRGIATSRPPGPYQSSNATGRGGTSFETYSKPREKSTQCKLHQHHVLQYGQGGQLSHSATRQHRMLQLRPGRGGEKEGADEEEVDQLLHWSRCLDNTVLTTPQSLL